MTQIPLRWVLVVPFVLQTLGAVGLVGYLSYRSGQQSVANLVDQLMNQTSSRISNRLDAYLRAPQDVVRLNQLEMEQGLLDPDKYSTARKTEFKSGPVLRRLNFHRLGQCPGRHDRRRAR